MNGELGQNFIQLKNNSIEGLITLRQEFWSDNGNCFQVTFNSQRAYLQRECKVNAAFWVKWIDLLHKNLGKVAQVLGEKTPQD